jgi:hypothetical protein
MILDYKNNEENKENIFNHIIGNSPYSDVKSNIYFGKSSRLAASDCCDSVIRRSAYLNYFNKEKARII